jgi:tetratricopeptide (TPR) repeat protein
MNPFHWLFGGRSVRSSVLALYKRGLANDEKHDPQAALEAYTAAIDLQDAPEDVRAMALYNRALLLAAAGETVKAIADLHALLAIPLPLREVKSAARRRLDRMQHQHDARVAVHREARPSM